MIRVIIADDHEIIRNSLRQILDLESDITVLATFADGLKAFEYVKENKVDIVLMDAVMPICSGIKATEMIKRYDQNIKVLLLTTFSDKKLILEAFNAKVDGYVLKDISSKNLVKYIYECIDGSLIIPNEIAAKLVSMATGNCDFNFTEKEVIDLLKEGLSNKQIAEKLNISYGTARNYVSSIYKKVGADNREQALEILMNSKFDR